MRAPPAPTMAEVLTVQLVLTSLADDKPASPKKQKPTISFLTETELPEPSASAVLMHAIQPVASLVFANVRTRLGASMGVSMTWSVDPRVLARHGPQMSLLVPRSPLRAPQRFAIDVPDGTLLLPGARISDLEGVEVKLVTLGDEVSDDEEEDDLPLPWRAYGYVGAS